MLCHRDKLCLLILDLHFLQNIIKQRRDFVSFVDLDSILYDKMGRRAHLMVRPPETACCKSRGLAATGHPLPWFAASYLWRAMLAAQDLARRWTQPILSLSGGGRNAPARRGRPVLRVRSPSRPCQEPAAATPSGVLRRAALGPRQANAAHLPRHRFT